MTPIRHVRYAAAAAALVLVGCTAETEAPETPAATETADLADERSGSDADADPDKTPATEDPSTEIPAVYGFQATTRDGEVFDGASLAGQPAVLWFWAPWCPTCIGQIPTVTGLAEEHGEDLAVVGVGGLDDAQAIIDLADDSIPHVLHLIDDTGQVWRHFGMTQQSTFVVLDADGEVVADGIVDDATLQDLAAQLAG